MVAENSAALTLTLPSNRDIVMTRGAQEGWTQSLA